MQAPFRSPTKIVILLFATAIFPGGCGGERTCVGTPAGCVTTCGPGCKEGFSCIRVVPCVGRGEANCKEFTNCRWDGQKCIDACAEEKTEEGCDARQCGVAWCSGTPLPCGAIPGVCQQGCSWVDNRPFSIR